MRALDLFCKAGGATKGLQQAGFHVTGIDIEPQPNYCGDEFVQADATNPPFDLSNFDFIWASPPCQAFSIASRKQRKEGKVYPDLVDATRALLSRSGKPWAIENVPGAPIRPDVVLCGSHFGLPIVRHRLFELSFDPPLTPACNHVEYPITVCGHGTPTWMRQKRIKGGLHPNATVAMKKAAMGIDWMKRHELSQAIPPAYAEFIGRAAIRSISHCTEAAK